MLEVPGGATEECRALGRGYTRATKVAWWWSNSIMQYDEVSTSPYVYRGYRTIFYTAYCRR